MNPILDSQVFDSLFSQDNLTQNSASISQAVYSCAFPPREDTLEVFLFLFLFLFFSWNWHVLRLEMKVINPFLIACIVNLLWHPSGRYTSLFPNC